MSSIRARGSALIVLRSIVAFLVAALFIVQATPYAFAGTTGILNGTVIDVDSQAPLANVKVTASAPTGTYSATTNSRGFFSMAGVYSDTYTVSFQAEGYSPVSHPGVTVFADQTQTDNASLTKQLTTIAKVTARSVGGAYQPKQTTDTYTVTSQQISAIQGTDLNLNEAGLLTSLPGASSDSSGYPVIRGGRENEENFEFEGIPFTDAFTNQFTNSLSASGIFLQSAQLTPLGNAAADNSGTGTFNLVAKRGAYPSFGEAQFAVGGPAFRHGLNLEYGWATPNGRISNYTAFVSADQGRAYGSLNSNVGPIGDFFGRSYQSDREFLDNLIFKFGKNNNQQLQFFTDIDDHHFFFDEGGTGGLNFRSADPLVESELAFLSGGIVGGTGISPAELAQIQGLDPHQTFFNETLGQANRSSNSGYQPNEAFKLGYAWNINSSTFLEAMAYSTNAVTTFDQPLAGGYATGGIGEDVVALQGGKSTGFKVDLTKQLSDKNILKIGGQTRYLHPVFDFPDPEIGLFSTLLGANSLLGGTGGTDLQEFLPTGSPACAALPGCGYIYNPANYFPGASVLPAGTKVPSFYENTSTNRNDFDAYVNDTWSPNAKLKIDAGLRFDGTDYHLPTPGFDPATCTSLYLPNYVTDSHGNIVFGGPSTTTNPAFFPNGCPEATFNLTNAERKPIVPEPLAAVSYTLGAHDSVRASYGRSVEFAPLGDIDFSTNPGFYAGFNGIMSDGGASCGARLDTTCTNFGEELYYNNLSFFGNPVQIQPVRPTTFINYDFSYSHEFTKGILNGTSFRLTPWHRKAYDEIAQTQTPLIGANGQPVLDANGNPLLNPAVTSNSGFSEASGVEFQLTHLSQRSYGLSGQFSATYQNEFSSVIPLSGSEDFFPTIPAASLALGNIYRVGFLSPFQTSLDLSYETKSGWRIAPQIDYNIGYPLSPGTLTAAFVDGKPFNIANTNQALTVNGLSSTGAFSYLDPLNPGSLLNPNINSDRGVGAKAVPGALLSHAASNTDLTIEYNGNKKYTAGLQIFNLFDSLYGGSILSGRYQPLAQGISGPLSGDVTKGFGFTQPGLFNRTSLVRGQNAYIDDPNGIRNYYLYFTVKM